MKILRRDKNEDIRTRQAPLDILRMEQMLSRISCHAGLAGFSAAAFALSIWYCILWLLYGNDPVILILTQGQIAALVAAGIMSCFLQLLMKSRTQRFLRFSVYAYPNATDYY